MKVAYNHTVGTVTQAICAFCALALAEESGIPTLYLHGIGRPVFTSLSECPLCGLTYDSQESKDASVDILKYLKD